MPISIEADPTLAQGYIKVNGTTAATVTSTGLTTASLQNAAVTPAKLSQPYTLDTAKASTSGTSIDFTGIPSWAKRITVMFNGVSTNGTSAPLIQLGDSGGFETTGYLGSSNRSNDGGTNICDNYTAGFGINGASASNVYHGSVVLTLINAATFTWLAAGQLSLSSTTTFVTTAGSKSLSAALDRIRITTVNGTDTFDAGTINIAYEG